MLRTEIPMGQVPTLDDLKKSIYLEKLEKLKGIITKVQEKGVDYKIDKLVDQFRTDLSGLTSKDFEQLTKVLFTILFNKDFINLDQLPPIDVFSSSSSSSSSSSRAYPPSRGGGNYSRGGAPYRGGGAPRGGSGGGGGGYRRRSEGSR
jgi:hypothetical protein